MALKRQAITDTPRRNIRRHRAQTGNMQTETIGWFATQQSGRIVTQSQISTIPRPLIHISTTTMERMVS
jgi:hypothetical protein